MSVIEVDLFEEHCSTVEKEILRLLRLSVNNQQQILQNQEKIMSQLDTLNAALDGISSTLTTVATDAQTIESDLAALQSANPAVDLSGVIAKAQAIQSGLSKVDAGLKAAAPPETSPVSSPI